MNGDLDQSSLAIVPANEASWPDLQAVFGVRGDPSRCFCQRYRTAPRESWASVGADELAARLREQTECGNPGSRTTSGLVAYLDGEPVGWCAVAPRTAYPRMLRNMRVPWEGRTEDKDDESVWAVTCFVTRAGFRKRGITHALARAAVDCTRERGARALEGYPITTKDVILSELHVGTVGVSRPPGSPRSAARRCDGSSCGSRSELPLMVSAREPSAEAEGSMRPSERVPRSSPSTARGWETA